LSENFEFNKESKDIGHVFFNYVVSRLTSNERLYIYIFDCFIVIPIVVAIANIKARNAFFLFFIFCSFFFFKTIGINIMRQGVALGFFLLGLSLYFKNYKRIAMIFFVAALLFHFSILLPLFFFFFCNYFKTPKYFIYVYIFSIFLSFFGFGFAFLASKFSFMSFIFEDNRLSSYANSGDDFYEVGFRLNFVIFNSFFAFIGHYLYVNRAELSFKYYNTIYFSFLLLSSVFFLSFDFSYSDRSGLLSWILIPLLLVPFDNFIIIKNGTFKVFILCILLFIYFNTIVFS
jgi:hypothetical protein